MNNCRHFNFIPGDYSPNYRNTSHVDMDDIELRALQARYCDDCLEHPSITNNLKCKVEGWCNVCGVQLEDMEPARKISRIFYDRYSDDDKKKFFPELQQGVNL